MQSFSSKTLGWNRPSSECSSLVSKDRFSVFFSLLLSLFVFCYWWSNHNQTQRMTWEKPMMDRTPESVWKRIHWRNHQRHHQNRGIHQTAKRIPNRNHSTSLWTRFYSPPKRQNWHPRWRISTCIRLNPLATFRVQWWDSFRVLPVVGSSINDQHTRKKHRQREECLVHRNVDTLSDKCNWGVSRRTWGIRDIVWKRWCPYVLWLPQGWCRCLRNLREDTQKYLKV